jgi:hypothetical protein
MDNTRYFSINQLSQATGIDRRTIKQRLNGLKYQFVNGNGHYYDGHEAFLRIFETEKNHSGIEKKIQREQLRIHRAKAETVEIELARLRGELIPIEIIVREYERELSIIRAAYMALPSKAAKQLVTMNQPAEIFEYLKNEINAILEELSSPSEVRKRNGQEKTKEAQGSESN